MSTKDIAKKHFLGMLGVHRARVEELARLSRIESVTLEDDELEELHRQTRNLTPFFDLAHEDNLIRSNVIQKIEDEEDAETLRFWANLIDEESEQVEQISRRAAARAEGEQRAYEKIVEELEDIDYTVNIEGAPEERYIELYIDRLSDELGEHHEEVMGRFDDLDERQQQIVEEIESLDYGFSEEDKRELAQYISQEVNIGDVQVGDVEATFDSDELRSDIEEILDNYKFHRDLTDEDYQRIAEELNERMEYPSGTEPETTPTTTPEPTTEPGNGGEGDDTYDDDDEEYQLGVMEKITLGLSEVGKALNYGGDNK